MAQKHSSLDITRYCVQKIGELTDSGYNEIVATFQLKHDAEMYLRNTYGPRWRRSFVITHRSNVTFTQEQGYKPSTVKTGP